MIKEAQKGELRMKNFFTREGDFYKRFFTLMLTIAAQNVIVFGVGLADNIMVGAFSETALSGVALANQIQFILQMLTMGVGDAIVTLASQYWGKRQTEPIRRITTIGIYLGVAISLLMWAAVFFFPNQCLGLFIDDAAVIAEGAKYLKIICFSYFFFSMTNILTCALRSVETVKVGFYVSLAALAVNVTLNYILIFGKFGAPRMGVQGAAIATLVSRVAEFGVVMVFLALLDKKLRYRLKDLLKLDIPLLKDYIRVGVPVVLTLASWGISQSVHTAILGHMGAQSVAANSIASTIFQVVTVITSAAGSTAAILIGKTVGSGELGKVKPYARTLQVLFVALGLVASSLLFFSKDLVLSFYNISPETYALATTFIEVLCVTVVGTAYQASTIGGIIRGGGNTRFMLFNDLIFTWLVVTPLSALAAFAFHWPPAVVFFCLKIDQLLKCVVAVIKCNRFRWVRTLTRDEEPVKAQAAAQD